MRVAQSLCSPLYVEVEIIFLYSVKVLPMQFRNLFFYKECFEQVCMEKLFQCFN